MSTLIIEKAKLKNLKDLIYLLFDDDLGKQRENLSDKSINKYKKSFTKILNDSNNEIFIMILNDQIIGTMQLTFIPGLTLVRPSAIILSPSFNPLKTSRLPKLRTPVLISIFLIWLFSIIL